MAGGERVVVVDGLSEIGEVLKAVLEPRGVCVEQMRKSSNSRLQGEQFRPNVVVIDEDAANYGHVRLERWPDIPQVVIGSANISAGTLAKVDDRHYLQKPFQYRELIQAIERLLGER